MAGSLALGWLVGWLVVKFIKYSSMIRNGLAFTVTVVALTLTLSGRLVFLALLWTEKMGIFEGGANGIFAPPKISIPRPGKIDLCGPVGIQHFRTELFEREESRVKR